MAKRKNRHFFTKERVLYGLLFLAILVADQVTKVLVRGMGLGEKIVAIPKVLWFTHLENTGASFSMLTGSNLLLIFIALLVLGALIYNYDSFKKNVEKIAYILLLSGIFGNLIDRVLRGSVTDFLDLGWFPVFNLADSALVIGVILLIVHELFMKKKVKKR